MYAAFNEQGFLADLARELRESLTLADGGEIGVMVLDRPPEEGDILAVSPPCIVITPGGPYIPEWWGDTLRVSYPVQFLCIAQTLDAAQDSDRWTDETQGGAKIRERLGLALGSLGPEEKGAFVPTGAERVNYVDINDHSPSLTLRVEDGVDFSVPGLLAVYDVEASNAL